MPQVPDGLLYTPEDLWVATSSSTTWRVGLTTFALEAMGHLVHLDLPKTGTRVAQGRAFGEAEFTNSVCDLYGPLTGRVTAVNEAVLTRPQLVHEDPLGAGWLVEIGADLEPQESLALLSAPAYRALIHAPW